MPAHKKHASTRARANKASTAATLSIAEAPDYSSWSLAELCAEVDNRVADGADIKKPTSEPALVAVLEADDATELAASIPDLPERPMGWHAQTCIWWTAVWSSPMSNEWHADTDVHNVLAAAMHLDDMWQAETPAERQKADTQFLKRIASLGLTPYDRRRLEWTIETAAAARDAGARRRQSGASNATPQTPPDPAADPRRHFSVVS